MYVYIPKVYCSHVGQIHVFTNVAFPVGNFGLGKMEEGGEGTGMWTW